MPPPILLPSSGSNSKGECDLCTLRNRSQSAQHSDIIFLRATNFFKHLLTIFLQAVAQHAGKQKMSFASYSLCIFTATESKQCALTDTMYQAIYFFLFPLKSSSCFSFVSDRGRGCHGQHVFGMLRIAVNTRVV